MVAVVVRLREECHAAAMAVHRSRTGRDGGLSACRATRPARAMRCCAVLVDIERASERAGRERGLSGEASVLLVGVEDALDGDDVGSGAQAGEVAFLEDVDECREGVLDDGFEFVVDAFF